MSDEAPIGKDDVRFEPDDVVAIYGMRYSGALFRALARDGLGTWIRIEHRDTDVVTLSRPSPEMSEAFDAMVTAARMGIPLMP